MPPSGPSGEVDARQAPDFIAVAGREADIVGYVPKRFMFPEETTSPVLPQLEPWPVYADDLRTLIGHMVPGKGFVPLGVDPVAVPDIPVEQGPSLAPVRQPDALTVYVRSALSDGPSLAVRVDGINAGPSYTFGNGVGVACIGIQSGGGHLLVLDRPPQDAGATTLRDIQVRGESAEAPTLWIDMTADHSVIQGSGVPAWWSGEPQAC